MKKIVPDPPRPRLIHNHYFLIDPTLKPTDALVYANEFLHELHQNLDESIRHGTHELDPDLLAKARCNAEFARSLIEYAAAERFTL